MLPCSHSCLRFCPRPWLQVLSVFLALSYARGEGGDTKVTDTDKMKETELFIKMDADKIIDTKEKLVLN